MHEIRPTNEALGRNVRLAKEASDGVAAEASASTAQIQEDARQIVTVLVLHEGTRDPRHRPFESRRRGPCGVASRGVAEEALGCGEKLSNEASDGAAAEPRVPAAEIQRDTPCIIRLLVLHKRIHEEKRQTL